MKNVNDLSVWILVLPGTIRFAKYYVELQNYHWNSKWKKDNNTEKAST